MKQIAGWLRAHTDIDQLLIFFLLAVTVDQAGYWLGGFAPAGRSWLGYLHAAAVDLAIWRSGWWLRKYSGKKQRRWAGLGVVVFSLVSAGYNFGYYSSLTVPDPENAANVIAVMEPWQAALMAVVLPAAVALLSYLYGQKDESAFKRTQDERAEKKAERDTAEPAPLEAVEAAQPDPLPFACDRCPATFATQQALAGHSRAHRNGNGTSKEKLSAMEVMAK